MSGDLLESCIGQMVYEPGTGTAWEEVWTRVHTRLADGIRAGRVRRGTAVERLRRALQAYAHDDADASWLAEGLPYRGSPAVPVDPTAINSAVVGRPATNSDRTSTVGAVVDDTNTDLRVWVSGVHGPRDNAPTARQPTWSRLRTRLSTFAVYPDKTRCPLWSPAAFRDGRRRAENVESISCMVLDFDDGVAWSDVLPRWVGIAGVVHTSWSHTLDHPKWRLVMPFCEPVPVEAWSRVWSWASMRVEESNDLKCKDPGRIYFVPAVRSDEAPRFATILEGRPLVVPSSVLERPKPKRSAPPVQRRRVRNQRRSELFKTDEAARRDLGLALGGRLVADGKMVKGVRCPAPTCGRPSLAWWVVIGSNMKARCNHEKSCGASFWLDELE